MAPLFAIGAGMGWMDSAIAQDRNAVEASATDYRTATAGSGATFRVNVERAPGQNAVTTTDSATFRVIFGEAIATDGRYDCQPVSPRPNQGDTIEVQATDRATGQMSPVVTATVDETPPTQPTVDPTDGSLVTGSGAPGKTIDIRDQAGSAVCSKTVTATGTFAVPSIRPSALGDVLEVTATNPVTGNHPTITAATETGVTGTARPGDRIDVTDPNTGERLCSTTVAADGNYTCGPLAPEPAVVRKNRNSMIK